MQKSNLFALSAITMACAMAVSGMAQAAEAEQAKDEKVHQLQAVQVDEVYERTGEIKITEAELKMQPSANHSITDAFRAESSIQFDVNSRNGATGAEILPPQISIRGARPSESNYMINGVSNNNVMASQGWDPKGASGDVEMSGDIQGVMISTDLVDNIKLYSENVSAEYGDFTGGVVDARIRDARADRWHVKAWVRHTRDSWAQQHFTEFEEDVEFPEFEDRPIQKEFKKSTVGLTLDGPLFDGKLGALVSYQKTHSSTPAWVTFNNKAPRDKWEKHDSTRDLDNFLVRVNTDPANDFYISTTLMYSPYEAEMYASNIKDLAIKNSGGGWNFSLNTRANLSFGTWTNDLGWNQFEASSSQGKTELYGFGAGHSANWAPASRNTNIGGYGDNERTQDTVNFKSILTLNPLMTGEIQHVIRGGVDVVYRNVNANRDTWTQYQNAGGKNIVDHTGSSDGIYGDYVYKTKVVNHGYDETQSYTTAAIFLEDTLKYERFTFRPGVRVTYDDVTEDVTVAPRLKFDADILNDDRFHFNAGYNRYYGSQLLDYSLRVKRYKTTYTRTLPVGGSNDVPEFTGPGVTTPTNTNFYDMGELETPYSDEFVLGTSAKLFDTKFALQGVYRKYEDQLSNEKIRSENRPYTYRFKMNNKGESEYKGLTLTAEKSFDLGVFGKHVAELGITRSDLETSSRLLGINFGSPEDVDYQYVQDEVYLDGKLIDAAEVPASNFNSDWVVTYNHSSSFMDDRLRSTLWLRWESPADRILEDMRNPVLNDDGLKYHTYKTVENQSIFNADFSLAYDLIKTANSTLTLNMDVTNLFDKKNITEFNPSTAPNARASYSMGRQFFLGMSYEY